MLSGGNNSTVGLTTTSEPFKPSSRPSNVITICFLTYYVIVLLVGVSGNVLVLVAVYKYKRMRSVVNIFLGNLALSDLLFAALSVFDCIAFMQNGWFFGDLFCRIQGTLIEVSYTVSILTLVAVSIERYLAICYPHRKKRTVRDTLHVIGLSWLISLVICSALFYGYTDAPSAQDEEIFCRNTHWTEEARIVFYTFHSVAVYVAPLVTMCLTHCYIWRAISKNKKLLLKQEKDRAIKCNSCLPHKRNSSLHEKEPVTPKKKIVIPVSANNSSSVYDSAASSKKFVSEQTLASVRRRSRVVKLLFVVILTFLILWTPFTLTRIVMYLGVSVNPYLWKFTQLLILGSTASNCVIYACMSSKFRKAFRQLLAIRRTEFCDGPWTEVSQNSRSPDLSASSSRRQFVLKSSL